MTILMIFLASIGLHELGHALMAKLVGAKIKAWGLNRTGPYVRVSINPPCMWRAQLCLFSGPLVNLLLSLLFLATNPVLHVVGMLNLPFALFNLLLPRSDGWQMWKATTGATWSGAAALEARVWICGRDS